MMKRIDTRRIVQALLLPGTALVLAGVCEAEFIFHVANYMYLHEEDLPLNNRLCSGDFDGDEMLDFVLGARTSTTEGYLEVFLGNGDGTFQALDHVATKEIWAWAVGDLDNNGLDDVLIKDYDGYTLGDTAMCYLSMGNGQFADPISVPGFLRQVGGSPNHTDVDDYDMDGNLDIALAAFDSVEVYLGAGDGSFSCSWRLRAPADIGCISVESGDLDNDGFLDLIPVAFQSFGIFPGLGDGTFGICTTGGSFSGPGYPNSADVCCGDFNEDGWNDVAVTSGNGIGSWTIFVFLNHGDGTFSVNADYVYIDGWHFFDIFCEDLDLDGHLDLGASLGFSDQAMFLRGAGDGSFDATQPLWSVVYFGGLETARGDFDGDGDPDVAVTRYEDETGFPSGIYVIPNETIQNGIEGGEPFPGDLTLRPSCNPFASSVAITCEGSSQPAMLEVFDIAGRLVRSLSNPEGASFTWDGRDEAGAAVPTGTYLIRGYADGQVSSVMVVRL